MKVAAPKFAHAASQPGGDAERLQDRHQRRPAVHGEDLVFWQGVNAALDEVLDAAEAERELLLERLHVQAPAIAAEVRRLLNRLDGSADTPDGRSAEGGSTTELREVLGASRQEAFERLLGDALGSRADPTAASDRHSGERCGPWRLRRRIGSGGMGEVWEAERADGMFAARVAIKFLHEGVDHRRFAVRFRQERAVLARLDHRNIARLLDAGQSDGVPWIVLEFVDGMPLLEAVAARFPDIDSRLGLIEQIADALAYAHRQLVVHRDVKPSNVLVTSDGRIKLLDFGVAGLLLDDTGADRSESATQLAGRGMTLEYAAPELIAGESAAVSVDVYSLAALTFHVLTGRQPHQPSRPTRVALEYAILHKEPPRASDAARQIARDGAINALAPAIDHRRLRGDLDAILATALRKDPGGRYGSVEAFLSDLRRWRERRPIAARRHDRRYRLRLWFQRNWLSASLGGLSLLLLVAGFGATWTQYRIASAEAGRAAKATRYLADLLQSADPDLNGGTPPDVIDLLDRAARDIRARFADDPATEYELTQLLATTYRSLGRDADALPMAQRAVELATSHFGVGSAQARESMRTLAEVQYWSGDFAGARVTFQAIPKPTIAPAGSNLIASFEVSRLRAEIECANFSFDTALAQFEALKTHAAITQLDAAGQRWARADLAGREAICHSRSGAWPQALALLQRHAADYADPPANQRRSALYHREHLLSAQSILGDTSGVEASARALMHEWQELAGPRSDRIDTLLTLVGQFHMLQGNADAALAAFGELESRARTKPPSEFSVAAAPILALIEAETLFNTKPADVVLTQLTALVDQLIVQGNRALPRFRQQLFRAAIVALTLGRTDLAEHWTELGRVLGQDRAPSSAIRELQVKSLLARAYGRHEEAARLFEARLASFEHRGERISLRRALLSLGHAYQLWLAGERSPERLTAALRAARAALPEGLPADHLYHLQSRWLEALFTAGEGAPAEHSARAALAKGYGRRVEDMPRVLNGLFLL